MGVACGQVDFESLKDDGNAVLELPYLLLKVRLHDLFGFAEDGGVHIDSGGVRDARLACGEHDGDAGVTRFSEVGVLGHVLFFVGCNCPDAEVVDLLIFVVGDFAGVAAALGLKDADGFAFALG
jgi:hypothetical protein